MIGLMTVESAEGIANFPNFLDCIGKEKEMY